MAAEGSTQKLTVSSASGTWNFPHNLGEKYPTVTIYDDRDKVVIPSYVEAIDDNNMVIYFPMPQTGTAVATIGGGLPAQSSGQQGYILRTNGSYGAWEPISQIGLAVTGSNTFSGTQTVTGSVNITSTMKLSAQHPLPSGTVGTLAVSGSNLYYHNGTTWQQIN